MRAHPIFRANAAICYQSGCVTVCANSRFLRLTLPFTAMVAALNYDCAILRTRHQNGLDANFCHQGCAFKSNPLRRLHRPWMWLVSALVGPIPLSVRLEPVPIPLLHGGCTFAQTMQAWCTNGKAMAKQMLSAKETSPEGLVSTTTSNAGGVADESVGPIRLASCQLDAILAQWHCGAKGCPLSGQPAGGSSLENCGCGGVR